MAKKTTNKSQKKEKSPSGTSSKGFDFNNVVPKEEKSNKDMGPPDIQELQKSIKEKRAPNRRPML